MLSKRFNVQPRCIRRLEVDGGTVAQLEPVLCLRRYLTPDGGVVAVLEPARCQ